jgi:hypothetical protein
MYPLPPRSPPPRGQVPRGQAQLLACAEASSDGTPHPPTTSFPRRQVRKRHGNHKSCHSRRSENEHIEGGNPFVRLGGSPPSSREERTCGDDWLLRPYSRSGCTRSRGGKFRGGKFRRDAAPTNHVIPAEASSDGTRHPPTTSFPRKQVPTGRCTHQPRHSRVNKFRRDAVPTNYVTPA